MRRRVSKRTAPRLYKWLGRQVDERHYHFVACTHDGQRWNCEEEEGQDGDSIGGRVGGADVLGSEHSEAGREPKEEAYRLDCTSSETENRRETA